MNAYVSTIGIKTWDTLLLYIGVLWNKYEVLYVQIIFLLGKVIYN